MAIEVIMPQLGLTMSEGTVVKWLKAEGERVARGEPLMEITSEKATVRVESPVAGVVERILVPVGGTVPVGAPVCLVAAEGEAAAASAAAPHVDGGRAASPPGTRFSPPAAAGAPAAAVPEEPRTRASGLARRMAQERGIDLAGLRGSGPRRPRPGVRRGAFLAADKENVGKGLVPFRTVAGDRATRRLKPAATDIAPTSGYVGDKPRRHAP